MYVRVDEPCLDVKNFLLTRLSPIVISVSTLTLRHMQINLVARVRDHHISESMSQNNGV